MKQGLLFEQPKTVLEFTEKSSPKDIFYIRPIKRETAILQVIENHYLHRACPCSFSFGLFDKKTDTLIGVIIYGTPSSAPLRSGICGPDEKENVIELTRLWVMDGTPKNTESFFIGNTIKRVNKQIIVSFADIEQGHKGIIYQATNWIYTGLSAKRTDWKVEGVKRHGQTIADKYSASELKTLCGDRFTLSERSRKHRYVYFNCCKTRRRKLIEKLKYGIYPYPK